MKEIGELEAIASGSATDSYRVVSESSLWLQQPVTVSAVVITYKQESFVRSAIESVLSQTYPIDIVIADDASPDGTFTEIAGVLEGYQGPHRIRLLRASRNRGICRNQNTALKLTQGELIVFFEGDDISVPERVACLVSAYQNHSRAVAALGSAVHTIDQNGQRLETITWPATRGDATLLVAGGWTVSGCGLAIRRDCFVDVGPISIGLISGDIAFWMRAVFLRSGGVACVPQPLVNYRLHGDNTSGKVVLSYSSRAVLRECCRRLLRNEVAQVLELKKIAIYRRSNRLQDSVNEGAWTRSFRTAQSRAGLTLAVSRQSRAKWIVPALRALRYRRLRGFAIRVIARALYPFAFAG